MPKQSCVNIVTDVTCGHVLWKVRPRLESDAAFKAITLEADRVRLFKEHIASLEDSHRQHSSSTSSSKRHAKKNKKQKRRSESASPRSYSQVCCVVSVIHHMVSF